MIRFYIFFSVLHFFFLTYTRGFFLWKELCIIPRISHQKKKIFNRFYMSLSSALFSYDCYKRSSDELLRYTLLQAHRWRAASLFSLLLIRALRRNLHWKFLSLLFFSVRFYYYPYKPLHLPLRYALIQAQRWSAASLFHPVITLPYSLLCRFCPLLVNTP